jgi:rhomboid protease GluP
VRDDDPAGTVVRVAPGRRRAEEWSLVLTATGIAHRIVPAPAGFELRVAAAEADAAAAALDAYARETAARRAVPAPPPAEYGPSAGGWLCAAALILAYRLTGPRPDTRWFVLGAAVSGRLRGGEWWRAVTALTLHAGPAHVLGNAVATVVFVTALSRLVGPGVAAWVALLAGAGGNALNALVQPAWHTAVGASTGVFGALGGLAGIAGVRRPSRLWVPLAAGLALLGLLGTGEGSDLGAHLFGFLAGAALGGGLGLLPYAPPPAPVQTALGVAAALAVVACWLVALA